MKKIAKTKKCPRCGNTFPVNGKNFYKNKATISGLSHYCKECDKAKRKEYYADNKELVNEANMEYYNKHKDEQREKQKAYYQKNKKKIIAKILGRYHENKNS